MSSQPRPSPEAPSASEPFNDLNAGTSVILTSLGTTVTPAPRLSNSAATCGSWSIRATWSRAASRAATGCSQRGSTFTMKRAAVRANSSGGSSSRRRSTSTGFLAIQRRPFASRLLIALARSAGVISGSLSTSWLA